ncbi:MAG: Bax inhibitor-1/YccA family protein [Myxococcales bacterium]
MNEHLRYGYAGVSAEPVLALPYLRRVYSLFSLGIALAVAGALVALYVGEPTLVQTRGQVVAIPPVVAFGIEHWLLSLLGYFGAFFAVSALRRTPGVNVLALAGYTFVSGLFFAPALFFAQLAASSGTTLSAAPVRDAFLLTAGAFIGLTSYTLVTRRDFSFLGATLNMGLWVVLGASLLAIFFQAQVFNLAIASVCVLLFGGYILYDTSRLLRESDRTDPVSDALSLFLDVVNLFLALLRILSAARDR